MVGETDDKDKTESRKVAIALIAAGRASMASRIPFGPYLALGAMIAILGGEPLTGFLEPFFTV